MKKIAVIALSIILVFGLAGCSTSQEKNNSNKTDALQFKTDYEEYNNGENSIKVDIKEQNPIKYASAEEVFSLFENGTGILYLGFPNCPWCRNMISILLDVAQKENIDTVYYLNPRVTKSSEPENYDHLKELLSDYLDVNADGEKTLYVPDVYFVKDGKIIGHHLGTVDSQLDPYISLTKEEKTELENIYKNYIQQIK